MRPSVKVVVGVVLAVGIALVLAVGVSAAFLPACSLCHMRDGFARQTVASSHAKVACGRCHGGDTVQARLDFGVDEVFGMALRVKDVDQTAARVSAKRCNACHSDQIKPVTSVNGLRIKHASCGKLNSCTDCHSVTAHGTALGWPRTVTMDMCYQCHGARGVPSRCDTCHNARLPSDRVKTATFRVTHGRNAAKTHGMGDMQTCGQCHEDGKCAKCHGVGLPHPDDFVARHGQVSDLPTAKCIQCHKKAFCNDCHQYEMPHPKRFLTVHAERSRRDGLAKCQRCHAEDDCTQCHLDHIHPVTEEQMKALGLIPADSDRDSGESTGGAR